METGGAQRVLLDQAAWFHARGVSVTAVFLYDKEGLYEDWQARADFPIVNLHARQRGEGGLRSAFRLVGGLLRLFRLLRSQPFSAVETFTHHANLIGIPLAWLAGVPVRVASHHGHILGFPRGLERLHAVLMNSRLTTRLVAVSRRVLGEAVREGVRAEKVSVIPNGVNLPAADPAAVQRVRAEWGLGAGDALVLAVGRMTAQKAHTFLLQAAVPVLARFPRTVFAIVGDGPLRAELEAEARALGIAAQVRMPGIRRDVPQCMAAADVFALPSRWEGLPMVLLEALGMGAAVVATRVEGVDEVITDGENGLLIAPEDAAGLAEALLRLLEDTQLRGKLSRAGQDCVRAQYTVDTMCAQYARWLIPAFQEDTDDMDAA